MLPVPRLRGRVITAGWVVYSESASRSPYRLVSGVVLAIDTSPHPSQHVKHVFVHLVYMNCT
jgi:hypothetical protein